MRMKNASCIPSLRRVHAHDEIFLSLIAIGIFINKKKEYDN
jgi:hypothetical protein